MDAGTTDGESTGLATPPDTSIEKEKHEATSVPVPDTPPPPFSEVVPDNKRKDSTESESDFEVPSYREPPAKRL